MGIPRRPRLPIVLALAAAWAGACAGPAGTPAERTRAALGEIFLLASFGDADRLAPRIVYRGEDPSRRWSDVCDPTDRSERTYVDRMGARIVALLGTQPATFVRFASAAGEEGVWQRWTVRGANGTATFGCLEIDGVIVLAEIVKH